MGRTEYLKLKFFVFCFREENTNLLLNDSMHTAKLQYQFWKQQSRWSRACSANYTSTQEVVLISAVQSSRNATDRSICLCYSRQSEVRKGSISSSKNYNRKARKNETKWPVSSHHVDVPFHAVKPAAVHTPKLLLPLGHCR